MVLEVSYLICNKRKQHHLYGQNEREIREVHSWSLVSERLLYRDIQPGTMFQLRQGDVSLLCQVTKLPHFHLSEEIIDHDSNKFVLRINSETSV